MFGKLLVSEPDFTFYLADYPKPRIWSTNYHGVSQDGITRRVRCKFICITVNFDTNRQWWLSSLSTSPPS